MRLAEGVHQALDRMDERLAAEAMTATDSERRQLVLEALSFVREQRSEVELRFRRAFQEGFETRLAPRRETAVATLLPERLSLLPQDELEERLALVRLAHRTHSRLDPDAALGIRVRLAALLDRAQFDEGAHPVSPEAVWEAMREALSVGSARPQALAVLLEAFEPGLTDSLGRLHRELNERLVAGGVVPVIRPAVQRAAAEPSRGPSTAARGEAAWQALARVGATGAAGVGDALGPEAASEEGVRVLLQRLAHGQPLARRQTRQLLADDQAVEALQESWPAATESLLALLTALQALPAAGTLRERLDAPLRDEGSALDRLTVEMVSMVFDAIDADARLAEGFKHQLMRLQVVAVKAALIDRGFFARRQHPMRRLLDRICEVGGDPALDTGHDGPLLAGVTLLVDRLLAGFVHELAVFDEALARLEDVVAEEAADQARVLAQAADVVDREDRRRRLAERATAAVTARLAAQPALPAFVRAFMMRWWPLALAADEPDEHARPSTLGLEVLDRLLWSLQVRHPTEIPTLASRLPALVRALQDGVLRAGVPDDEREGFFDALLRTHAALIAAAKRAPAGQPVPRAAAAVAPAPPLPDPPPPGDALLYRLVRGRLIDLVEREGDDPERFKLAWISPGRRLYVLSRHPARSLPVEAETLAAWFADGRARLVDEDGPLTRAIAAMDVES